MDNRAEYLDIDIITSEQVLTDAFADLGDEINALGYKHLKLYLDIDINDSEALTLQVLARREPGGDDYNLGLAQVSSASNLVIIDQETLVTNYDADAKQCYDFNLAGVKFFQLQVKVGVVGATAGKVLSAYGVLSNCREPGRTSCDAIK